jgi:sodium/bile acid cotransporter 7
VLVLPIMFYHQLQLFVCSLMARRYASRDAAPLVPAEVAAEASAQ